MKKWIAAFLAIVFCLAFAGCTADAEKESAAVESTDTQAALESISEEDNRTTEDLEKESEFTEDLLPEEPAEAYQVLVVYFSATGTTKGVAETIASVTGADLYEITPVQPYSSDDLNYNDNNSKTTKEQNDKSVRPEISGTVENWDSYSIVYLGYPIWWGEEPRILDTFVESYNFDEKTIIPFCTSGGSGVGSSDSNLEKNAEGGNWLSGTRHRSGMTESDIRSWIDGLDLD